MGAGVPYGFPLGAELAGRFQKFGLMTSDIEDYFYDANVKAFQQAWKNTYSIAPLMELIGIDNAEVLLR